MRIFATAFSNRSFSKASSQLHISQPTISEHIKNLETELGCSLFERLGRSIIPTREAELMYPRAMHIIEEADRLKKDMLSSSGAMRGEMTIGASTIPGSYILPGLCHDFRSEHPEVSFRVLIEDSQRVTDMVLAHEVIMGVVGSRMDNGLLKYAPFYKDELVIVASPTLGLPGSIGFKKLCEQSFILREEGSGTRKTMEGYFKKSGAASSDLTVSAVLGSTDAVKQAVKAALGISALSRVAVSDELAQGTIKEVRVRGLKMAREFYIVSHRKRIMPAPYNTFLKFLKFQKKGK